MHADKGGDQRADNERCSLPLWPRRRLVAGSRDWRSAMNLGLLADLVTPIRSWARRDPDAAAITHAGGTMTRRELDRRSDASAHQLMRRGMGPGDRVGVMGSISPGWCCTALGVLKLGGVIVPMTERLSATEA